MTIGCALLYFAFVKAFVMPESGVFMSGTGDSYGYGYYFKQMIPHEGGGAKELLLTLVTNPIFDLGLGLQGVVAVNLSLVLLALLYGAIALLVGALTGNRGLAAGIAAALAVIAFFSNSMASLVDILEIPQKLSPFYWYIGNEPLANGFSWFHISLLVVVTLAIFALAVVAFQHRDVGTHMRTLRERIGAINE